MKWGIEVLLALTGLIASPIGAAWYLSARLTSMEVKIDATSNELARRVIEASVTHQTFITREEFERWIDAQRRAKGKP